MSDLNALREKIRAFTAERDWAQFHNPKDMAISLSLEAAELLEHFQWKSASEVEEYLKSHRGDVADEMADVLIYLIELADILGIDLLKAANQKLAQNAAKYPVAKSRGNAKKYTEL